MKPSPSGDPIPRPLARQLRKFPPSRSFSALSLGDLLEARDHYHIHLAHLPNVVGTAVGRYLIRREDWWFDHSPDSQPPPRGYKHPTRPRTLFDSAARPWSWPCVLVFVDEWIQRSGFGHAPDTMVP